MTDRPPPPQTATPATARPWLARLHPSLFGMALGLLGLSGAWHRLQPAGVDAAGPLAEGLLAAALALLAGLLLLWLAKALRHGAVLRQELRHPVQGALLALMPVALLMAVALVAGRRPAMPCCRWRWWCWPARAGWRGAWWPTCPPARRRRSW